MSEPGFISRLVFAFIANRLSNEAMGIEIKRKRVIQSWCSAPRFLRTGNGVIVSCNRARGYFDPHESMAIFAVVLQSHIRIGEGVGNLYPSAIRQFCHVMEMPVSSSPCYDVGN